MEGTRFERDNLYSIGASGNTAAAKVTLRCNSANYPSEANRMTQSEVIKLWNMLVYFGA